MLGLLRQRVLVGLVSLCGLVALVGCGEKPKRIVLLMNGESDYWNAFRAGIEAANKDLGIKASLDVNNGDALGQIEKLKQYNTQSDIAGIAISPTNAANRAIVDELLKLKARGVKVITVDSDLDRNQFRQAREAFVGTDNVAAGQELGKCLLGVAPQGGDFVTFVGLEDAQNGRDRIAGLKATTKEKFKAIDNMTDGTDRSKARDNVRDAITNHPDLTALIGIWGYNAGAIVDVVTDKKVRDKYKVLVFDAEPSTLLAMSKGNVDAIVVQNPYQMGYQGVRLLNALIKADEKTIKEMLPNQGQPEGDIYDTGIKVVVPDEGSPLKAEAFSKSTEFSKFGEFQTWLKKYNLSGS